MADISITAANVAKGTGALIEHGTAGAAITAGDALYKDSADLDSSNKPKLKPAAHAASATADCVGVALNDAADEQPVTYQKAGRITIGGTVSIGEPYYVSGNAGGICPDADLGTGDYVTMVGIGVTAAIILLNIKATGVAHA